MNKRNLANIGFDDIKSGIIEYLKSKDEFSDWSFEGSNINYIIDMLTYATYFTNTYNAFTLNESFLDSANLRSSIIAHAKPHGYIPKSSTGSSAVIDFSLDINAIQADGLPIPNQVLIKEHTPFTVKISDTVYTFSPLRNYVIYNDGNNFNYNLELKEGEVVTFTSIYGNSKVIELPNKSDTSTLKVFVNGEEWEYSKNSINLKSDSKSYYIRENSNGLFEIYFGDNTISKEPALSDEIKVAVYVVHEDETNVSNYTPEITFGSTLFIENIDYTNYIKLSFVQLPYGGAKKESSESVRKNTINKIVTQDRAITIKDYQYIVEAVFSEFIDAVNVWDLNDINSNSVNDLGKVFICAKPKDYKRKPYLTQLQKASIIENLSKNYAITGIRQVIVDPLYYKINHNIKVYYKPLELDTSISDLEYRIKEAIVGAYANDITTFNTYLPVSRLQAVSDAVDASIVSTSIDVDVDLQLELQANNDFIFEFNSQNKIIPGSISMEFLNVHDVDNGDGTGIITSDVGDLGTVIYDGNINFTIIGNNITQDSTEYLHFSPVDDFVKVQFNQLLVDSKFTFEFIDIK